MWNFSGWVRVIAFVAIALLSAAAVFGQEQDARPAYEVASIKLNTSGSANQGVQQDKAQILFTGVPLKRLIQRAYKVYSFQVTGPAWMEDAYYDISAKYPPDLKDEDRPLMLRTLLEDRLKLAVHRESKQMQGYELVVAKGGFKLKPIDPGEPVTPSLGSVGPSLNLEGGFRKTTLFAKKASMASLADLVTRIRDEMVADRTGLTGVYDFELHWNNDDQNPAPGDSDSFPSLFTAIQSLGLRLQPQKVPVEMIVVDHVERVPTEN